MCKSKEVKENLILRTARMVAGVPLGESVKDEAGGVTRGEVRRAVSPARDR